MLAELIDLFNLLAVALVALDTMRHFAILALLDVQARRGCPLRPLYLPISCNASAASCVLEPGYYSFTVRQVVADRA